MDYWEVDALLSDMWDKTPGMRQWCFRNLHHLEEVGMDHPDNLDTMADEIMLELKQLIKEPDYVEELTAYFESL